MTQVIIFVPCAQDASGIIMTSLCHMASLLSTPLDPCLSQRQNVHKCIALKFRDRPDILGKTLIVTALGIETINLWEELSYILYVFFLQSSG